MASGPIISWEIDGEILETVSDFIFWGSQITADGDCSHEIKRCLLLDFPGGLDGKASVYNVGDWVRSLGREVPWRRKWQPTPVLLPRKSIGRRSLVTMGS